METTLGLVPLVRSTFDVALASQVIDQVRSQLEGAGFSLTGPAKWVSDMADADAVARRLADDPPDLLLVLQATFADSTMVTALAQAVDAPLLLWAVPEARTGGRLRLNSLCGINLAAHGLKRRGLPYDYVYAAPDDAAAMEKVRVLSDAGRVRRLLRRARVGRVGENPDGFESCKLDTEALQDRFGVEIVQLHLPEIFDSVKETPDAEVDTLLESLRRRLADLDALDQEALRRTLGTYLTLRRYADQENLHGLAVRCWPEFFTELGCAACGAMSMLSDELIPCSCEADVNGTVTQLILQWLSGGPAFGTDMVSFEIEDDLAVIWHCGLAPLAMADPEFEARGTIHSNRQLPLLMEFPLKPGRVTIARLSEAAGDGRYQLVMGSGEMVRAPMSFTGTSGVLRFDNGAQAALDTIMENGLEHHISLTYGDHMPALLALAKLLELPVVRL
ncbi:MAG: fucose isomerase [Anaerolineae bacterium]|jgi:L-fucose isomerase-like protein